VCVGAAPRRGALAKTPGVIRERTVEDLPQDQRHRPLPDCGWKPLAEQGAVSVDSTAQQLRQRPRVAPTDGSAAYFFASASCQYFPTTQPLRSYSTSA
jgi:hypothetical protein